MVGMDEQRVRSWDLDNRGNLTKESGISKTESGNRNPKIKQNFFKYTKVKLYIFCMQK